MEAILNDEALVGQFTVDSFIEYCRDELLPMLKMLEENDVSILKRYETYQKQITADQSMWDFINLRGNPFIDRMKCYLTQLTKDPYWESNPKTSSTKQYDCEISDIPNCITEAYERNALLLSFLNSRFNSSVLNLKCDGETVFVRNCTRYQELSEHFEELGYIITWKDNSFMVASLGYKFEIRFNEAHHNTAHFHMSNADEQISITIPDADIKAGSSRHSREIISWALYNMSYIKDLWNRYHPEMFVQ